MPVAADLSDCKGCPLRVFPTDCQQYKERYRKFKLGELGISSEIAEELPPA